MKIAVYTIAKNEEQFVERWYNSAKDADYLLIVDTGSTDNTYFVAKELGIEVASINVNPFRFDDARNAALAMIPSYIDYCISMDMDEVLSENWREELESIPNGILRPKCRQATNVIDGIPQNIFRSNRIHARNGYRWQYPVHETNTLYLTDTIETSHDVNIEILHLPDESKPRSQYLSMLKMAVKESPNNDRMSFYYGRELFYYSKYDDAIKEFKRYLDMPTATWNPERAYAMRYIAKCGENQEYWFNKAYNEYPQSRDAILDLADLYYRMQNWKECLEAAEKTLAIIDRPLEYFSETSSWSDKPYDLAAISSYYLGLYDKALEYGQKALSYQPNDERLLQNMEYYKKAHNPEGAII